MHEKLKHVLFISVPENISNAINGFNVDPAKLLPVETLSGDTSFSPEDLTWEMIIAGMLKVLAWEPDHEDASYFRDFVKAVKPDIGTELGSAGVIKAQEKDYEVAEEIFLSLSHLFSQSIDYHLNLAIVYQEQARNYEKLEKREFAEKYFDLAHQTYLDCSEQGEEVSQYHYNVGMFYLYIGNLKKAGVHLKRFLELDEEGTENDKVGKILEMIDERSSQDENFMKAYDFIQLGKENEGIELIRKFIESNQDSWNAWFMLGWALRRTAKYGDAMAAFERSLELNGNNIDTYNELAICNMELEMFSECRKNLEKALRIEPENLKILSNFGILALKQDKKDEAGQFFKTVLEFDPEDQIAKKYLEYLNID